MNYLFTQDDFIIKKAQTIFQQLSIKRKEKKKKERETLFLKNTYIQSVYSAVLLYIYNKTANIQRSIIKKKYLVWHSHNFLLPYITAEEYFIIIIAFIINLYFLCFAVNKLPAFIIMPLYTEFLSVFYKKFQVASVHDTNIKYHI